jgi:hypothetical protein
MIVVIVVVVAATAAASALLLSGGVDAGYCPVRCPPVVVVVGQEDRMVTKMTIGGTTTTTVQSAIGAVVMVMMTRRRWLAIMVVVLMMMLISPTVRDAPRAGAHEPGQTPSTLRAWRDVARRRAGERVVWCFVMKAARRNWYFPKQRMRALLQRACPAVVRAC